MTLSVHDVVIMGFLGVVWEAMKEVVKQLIITFKEWRKRKRDEVPDIIDHVPGFG